MDFHEDGTGKEIDLALNDERIRLLDRSGGNLDESRRGGFVFVGATGLSDGLSKSCVVVVAPSWTGTGWPPEGGPSLLFDNFSSRIDEMSS